jgi:hypothetical protein
LPKPKAASVGGLFVCIAVLIGENLFIEFEFFNQALDFLTPILPVTINRKLASFASIPVVNSRSPAMSFTCGVTRPPRDGGGGGGGSSAPPS